MHDGGLQNPLGGTQESNPVHDGIMPVQEPVRTTVDLWDLAGPDYAQATLPAADQFSNATQYIDAEADHKQRNRLIALIVVMCVLATVALVSLWPEIGREAIPVPQGYVGDPPTQEFGVAEQAVRKVKEFLGLQSEPVASPATDKVTETVAVETEVVDTRVVKNTVVAVPEKAEQPLPGNPYWILPNQLRGAEPKLARPWGADEEDGWRRMLQSSYVYQQYRMVQDIRRRKLAGSEVLLFEALRSRKFWTRMAAVIGIAEFGYPVDLPTVEIALGNARSDTVANYFKRFRLRPTGAEAFIMRHAVKLVGERARRNILQGLLSAKDDLSKLYLVASIYDPGLVVQQWSRSGINRLQIATETFLLYDKIVKGSVKAPLEMRKDDFIAYKRTNYERRREAALDILLHGQKSERVTVEENPDDGFSELEVIELRSEF